MGGLETIIQSNLALSAVIFSVLGIILLAFNALVLMKFRKINRKSREFFSGKKGKDLESLILKHSKEIKGLDNEIQELFNISNKIHKLSRQSLHKVGVIRFNPFKDVGGNQSFSIALLDGKNSGLVISSLYTRAGARIYAKPITKGGSKKHPLTEEEKQAIKIASPIKDGGV